MMPHILLIQLPIPRLNYGRRTGNIPLAAACLKQAAEDISGVSVDILPESVASFIGDKALVELVTEARPGIIGFTAFSWNIHRILFLSHRLKAAYGPKIVLGGPEVTPDNTTLRSEDIDFLVFGDGEAVFRKLLEEDTFWAKKNATESAGDFFSKSLSPYLKGGLEPHIENIMLLETQRGCPYHCAFCYYNKSHKGLSFADLNLVLEAIQWACNEGIGELFLLDPSLNVRRDLADLLKGIQRINAGRRLSLFSETRAEDIDEELADLFAAAGFKGFEIGLQSTHPPALMAMQRQIDFDGFIKGTRLLRKRGIAVAVDLIMGLPEDTPKSFRRSVDFVADNDLDEDVQLFPLSVLPGTEFRHRHRELGLIFDPYPPYTILQTPAFDQAEFLSALDYAESRLDTVFFPPPNLDIAWRPVRANLGNEPIDVHVRLGTKNYLNKLVVFEKRPLEQFAVLASRLTMPYQVFIGSLIDDEAYVGRILQILSAENPFCPFEVVLIDPSPPIAEMKILDHVRLQRPHFLDGDLRFLFAEPGNRAVLTTTVSPRHDPWYQQDMQRQVFWWRDARLPEETDLEQMFELDGVLIDGTSSTDRLREWQNHFAPIAADLPYVCFARLDLQKRWRALTAAEDYANGVMQYVVC